MSSRQAASVLVSSAVKARNKQRSISVAFRSEGGGVGRRDYATHWVHSYPAKMFHRIPQTIMSSVSEASTLRVLDPFCGSGTVLLEAILNGHSAVGIDVNPLARLISTVKTTALDTAKLRERLPVILARAQSDKAAAPPDTNLDYWFKTENRQALNALRRAIASIRNEDHKRFFLVSLSSIVRKTSLADPCIPPPVKLSRTRAERLQGRYGTSYEHAAALDRRGVFKLFEAAITANTQRMQDLEASEGLGTAEILSSQYELQQQDLLTRVSI